MWDGVRSAVGIPIMNNDEMMDATYLLERAAQCRRLARHSQSHGIAVELEKLACDYDKDAARLEAFNSGGMAAAAQ